MEHELTACELLLTIPLVHLLTHPHRRSDRSHSLRVRSVALCVGALVYVLAMGVAPAVAATPSVSLRAHLTPEVLGASTNVSIAFQIAAGAGETPASLSSFALRLPTGMGFAGTTLGLATCSQQALVAGGAAACPGDSAMGFGEALVQAPFGAQGVVETAPASIFMSKPLGGHTTMLFYFDGRTPVIAGVVLQIAVETPKDSSDSVLSSEIPQIPTAPGAPGLQIVALHANIGPRHILYYRRVAGRRVAYRPTGLNVPETCPRGGFTFAGEFGFGDGSHVLAKSIVPCPGHGRSRGGSSR